MPTSETEKRPTRTKKGASDRNSKYGRTKRSKNRRLFIESLESRQLLAITAVIDIPTINGGAVTQGATTTDSVIDGFAWGFRRETVNNNGTFSPGPAVFDNLSFQKQIDTASPDLITQSLLGPVYAKPVVLRYLETSQVISPGTEVLKLEFGNAQLTSFQATNDLDETATLSFGSLAMTESIAKDAQGALLPGKRTASFNLLNGSAVGAPIVNPHPTPSVSITDHTTLEIGGVTLDIDSYEWSMTANTFFNDSGSAGVGKPEFGDLEIGRVLDQATAGLLFAGVNGQIFPEIKIQERAAFTDAKGAPGFRITSEWKYSNAFITRFALDDDLGDSSPPENKLSFGYSKVEVVVKQFTVNGSPLSDTSWNFDRSNQKATETTDFGNQAPGLDSTATTPFFDFTGVNTGNGALAYDTLEWRLSRDPVAAKGRFGSLSAVADFAASSPRILSLLSVGRTSDRFDVDANERRDVWELREGFVSSYRVKGAGRVTEPKIQFDVVFRDAEQRFLTPLVAGQTGGQTTLSTGNFSLQSQASSTPLNLGKAMIETPFELEITDSTGAKSEIPILDAGAGFESFGVRSPNRFDFVSPRGIHSPGLFQATATGAAIPSAKLVRYATINGQRTEQYRWEITDTFLSEYSTNLSNTPVSDRESFSLMLDKSKVAVIYRDVDKSSTKNYFAGWDFNTGKKLDTPGGFVIGPSGLPLSDAKLVSHAKINEDKATTTPKLVGYRYSASLPVSNPLPNGTRTVGQATSNGSSYVFNEGPLPALFDAFLVADKLNSVESAIGRTVESKVGQMDQERQSTKLSSANGVTQKRTYGFSDSSSSLLPSVFVSYSDDKGQLTSKHERATSTSAMTWDLSKNTSTLTNGFGGFQFAAGQEPTTVLEIPAQAAIPGATQKTEFKLDSYTWFTENPVFQPVGTKSAPVPLAKRGIAQQVTFDLAADLTNAFPGLLYSLASGHKFPELKITQRRDVFLPNGTKQYLPYREWTLRDVYLTDLSQFTNDKAMSVAGSDLTLRLSVGKVVSKFFDYNPGARLFSISGNGGGEGEGPDFTTISNSLDYITPPVSKGIGQQNSPSLSIRVIPLLTFFSDEQEPAANLTYSYTVVDNPGLFDSIVINSGRELLLDFKNGLSGFATIRVDAIDAFGLIGSDTFVVAVDANGISDAPSGSDNTRTLDESKTYTITESDFGFIDPNDVPANKLTSVRIASLPAAGFGVLSLNNVPVTLNQDITAANIGLGLLRFTPTGKGNGTNYASFTFQVQDDGTTVGGGTNFDLTPNRMTFNVNPLPEVSGLTFGNGTAQRSMVRSITVDFDTTVSLAANTFVLERSVLGAPLSFSAPTPSELTIGVATTSINGGTQTRATLTFTGSLILGGSLPDGNYRFTIMSNNVQATTGSLRLDGNGDGTGGDDLVRGTVATDNFFRMFGDADGNGFVSNSDFFQFRRTLGLSTGAAQFNSDFDFDFGGDVTNSDFFQFRRRLGLNR